MGGRRWFGHRGRLAGVPDEQLDEWGRGRVGRCWRRRRLRAKVRGSLLAWSRLALAGQGLRPARHHRMVIAELEGLAAGRFDRLMLLLPPGSAKSTYTSLLFPPWFMAREPGAHVIAASHTASLAGGFGRGVRGLLAGHKARLGLRMDPTSRAAGRFGLMSGGSYFATGVRGPITGRRADLVIVDDPGEEPARGGQPGGAGAFVGVVPVRVGDAVAAEGADGCGDDPVASRMTWADGCCRAGTSWRVLRLPALAEVDDPMGRAAGEALWPAWENVLRRWGGSGRHWGSGRFRRCSSNRPRSPGGRLFQMRRDGGGGRAAGWGERSGLGPGGERAVVGIGRWVCGCALGPRAVRCRLSDVVRLQGGPEAVVQCHSGDCGTGWTGCADRVCRRTRGRRGGRRWRS